MKSYLREKEATFQRQRNGGDSSLRKQRVEVILVGSVLEARAGLPFLHNRVVPSLDRLLALFTAESLDKAGTLCEPKALEGRVLCLSTVKYPLQHLNLEP